MTRDPHATPRKPKQSEKLKANKRTPAEVLKDRTEFTRLWIRGHTQHQIAEWVTANRRYTLSRSQVAADLKAVIEEWRAERLAYRDEWIGKMLLKYHEMETELWQAWEASKGQIVRTQKKTTLGQGGTTDGGVEATVNSETSHGDPAYMALILRVQEHIRALLGLDAARRMELTGDGVTVTAPAIDVDNTPRTVLYLPENGRGKE
jgi:hypothetical protein